MMSLFKSRGVKKSPKQETRKRRVMIATPAHDGKVDVRFAYALFEAQKMNPGLELLPVLLPGEAIISKARNELLQMAVDTGDIDDLVFIDSDMAWTPDQLYHLLSHETDFVGGTARQKRLDSEVYTSSLLPNEVPDANGLLKVAGVGCAFLRLTNKAFMALYSSAKSYTHGNKVGRYVFELPSESDFYSEDIYLCKKWRLLGGEVFLDVNLTIGHVGTAVFEGNFANRFFPAKPAQQPD